MDLTIAVTLMHVLVGGRAPGTASLSKMLRSRYTAEAMVSLKSEDSLALIRERGLANLALGRIALSRFSPQPIPSI
jgi:hypothetical protein